jgi:hypothetical protein
LRGRQQQRNVLFDYRREASCERDDSFESSAAAAEEELVPEEVA